MKKVCLVVMDGWGLSRKRKGNATALARTPNIERLRKKYPHTKLSTSGLDAGLPRGQMGNSEVGHLTMGAGRVIFQEFTRINKAIENGGFASNPALADLIGRVRSSGGALHLMGLVSDGGVHSHIDHLYALLDAAKRGGVERVFVHAFLDGRDTLPRSGINYLRDLTGWMKKAGVGRVATVSGRYYAMDRDNRWERVEKVYDAIVSGEGPTAPDPLVAVEEAYSRGETDEFVLPTVITSGGAPVGPMASGDGALFFNFRSDRARELTSAFVDSRFKGFRRRTVPALSGFATMTSYDAAFDLPVLFPPQGLDNILGEVLSRHGVRQFRVSETEKYAHVTFFFNGGREAPFEGEDRLLIPSVRDVPTYDLAPEMRAPEIAEAAVEKINSGDYSFVLINFANGDMVGHTGVIEAGVAACEAVDRAVGEVVDAALAKGWAVLITSDHGNAEQMLEADNKGPMTAHTENLVPFILVDDGLKGVKLREAGGLKDVAPTVLKLMGIEKPAEMTGEPLF